MDPFEHFGESKKSLVLHLRKGSINSSISGDVNVVIVDDTFIIQTSLKCKTSTLPDLLDLFY